MRNLSQMQGWFTFFVEYIIENVFRFIGRRVKKYGCEVLFDVITAKLICCILVNHWHSCFYELLIFYHARMHSIREFS